MVGRNYLRAPTIVFAVRPASGMDHSGGPTIASRPGWSMMSFNASAPERSAQSRLTIMPRYLRAATCLSCRADQFPGTQRLSLPYSAACGCARCGDAVRRIASHASGSQSWPITSSRYPRSFIHGLTFASPSQLKVGAVCLNWARTDLCWRRVTSVL